MFLLNSCLGQFSAASLEALLLPKLRSHFAEFLNNASPVGLRILSSSTCVGLRYGYTANNSGFSWQPAHVLPYLFSVRITSSHCTPDFPNVQVPRLHRSFHSRLTLSFCVPTVLLQYSTGISTCCPSTTSFDLALGPDLPRADQLHPGTLSLSEDGILTRLIATHACILTRIASTTRSPGRFTRHTTLSYPTNTLNQPPQGGRLMSYC